MHVANRRAVGFIGSYNAGTLLRPHRAFPTYAVRVTLFCYITVALTATNTCDHWHVDVCRVCACVRAGMRVFMVLLVLLLVSSPEPFRCLEMPRYEKLASFAENAGLRFVFGLNAVWGRKDHDLDNPLGMVNIEALLAYTAKHGVKMWGFEV